MVFKVSAGDTPAEHMRITSTGNVGIGITSPAGKLHVDGHTSSVGTILEGNGGGDTVPLFFRTKANNNDVTNHGIFASAGSTGVDNYLTMGPTSTSGVIVDNSGNVGIGTTSPDRLLDVSGTGNVYGKFQSTNATGAGIEVKDTSEDWLIQADGGSIDGLAFYDLGRSAYRMVIDNIGNVAIGTTDTSDVRLRVDQNQNDDYTAFFKNTCAANAMVGVTFSSNETVNAANKFGFQILDNGTERFAARMNGDVYSYTNSYSSDIRLKENIEDCEPMLEKLKQVRIVDFDWKENAGPEGRQRGVIAQEIESIFPELIQQPNEYKEFKKSEMTPILVKAIQEQQEQIELLQQQIEVLKNGN